MQANIPDSLADGSVDGDGDGRMEVDGDEESTGEAARWRTCT